MNISPKVQNIFSGCTITDNGSSNKTRKNQLILQPHVRYSLENGDSVSCGLVEMQFFRKVEKENFLVPETPSTSRQTKSRREADAETQISEEEVDNLLHMETQPVDDVENNNDDDEVVPDLLDMETQAVDESVDNASEILSMETQGINTSADNATEILAMETQAVISSDDNATEMFALETQPNGESPSKASDILLLETQAVDETVLDGEASNKTKGSQKMDIDESIFNEATQLSLANENDNESNASEDLLTEDLVGNESNEGNVGVTEEDGNETDSSIDLIPSSQEETQMIRPIWAKQPSLSTVQEEPKALEEASVQIPEESTAKIADKEEHQAVRNPELVEEKKEEEEFNHEDEQDTDLNDSFDLLATTQSLVGSGDEGNNNDEEEEEKEEDEHQTTMPEEIVQVEREELKNEKSEDAETSSADYFIEADEDRLDFDLDDNPEETDNEEQKPNTNFDTVQIPKTDPKCEEKNVEVLDAGVSAEPSNPLIKEPEIDNITTNAVPSSDDPAANEKLPASKIQIETVQTTKESHETIATTSKHITACEESASLVQGIEDTPAEVPQENIKSSRRTPKIADNKSDEKMAQKPKKGRKTASKQAKEIAAHGETEEGGTTLQEKIRDGPVELEVPLENNKSSASTPKRADAKKDQKIKPKIGRKTQSPIRETLSKSNHNEKKKSNVKIIRLTKEPAKEEDTNADQPSAVLRRSSRVKRPSSRLSDISPSPKKSARLSIKTTRNAAVKKSEAAVTKQCSVRISDIVEKAQTASRADRKNVRKSSVAKSETHLTKESVDFDKNLPGTSAAAQSGLLNVPSLSTSEAKTSAKIPMTMSSSAERKSVRKSSVSKSKTHPKKESLDSDENVAGTSAAAQSGLLNVPSLSTSEAKTSAKIPMTTSSSAERKSVRKSSVSKSKTHPKKESLDSDENNVAGTSEIKTAANIPMAMAASRRKTATHMKPIIMFTGYQNQTDLKLVKDLGGTVTDQVAKCTVLVAEELRRTTKLLCALGRGIPIVSPHWLKQSKITKTFLDPWTYILSDVDAERKWNFILKSSLKKAGNNRLLDGYKVYATSNTLPKPQEIRGKLHLYQLSYIHR